jgi:predicted enzyme related to lactoylglutathione lyase
MNTQTNALNWFEIPVIDMERAKHFYQVAFGIHMDTMNTGEMQMASFPADMGNGKVSGSLTKSAYHKPSADGVVIYLNANPDLSVVLQRIQSEGGNVMMGKTLITPEIGYMAFFIDTEGNKVALHSQH